MGRRTAAGLLVAIGTIIAVLAILAVWVSRQVLETDQWTETSSELLEDPAVQTAVAGFLVDRLYANVNVQGELQAALPPRLDPLAGPAAGALRRGADDVALRALARPEVQQAWEQANRQAHEVFVDVIEGGGDVVGTQSGIVTLDLKALLDQIVQRTGIGSRVAGRLPADAASIEIVRSDELGTVQNVADALKPLALVLVLLMLASYGAAIAVARGRRRKTLRACGFGLMVAGAGALAVRAIAGDEIVAQLASTAAVEPAVAAVWDIGTSFLVGVAVATLAYGALTVAGAWLAGPTRPAVAIRRAVAPYVRDLRIAYGALAALILLVLIWGPTEATRRVLPALVLTLLLVAGFEVLRRRIVAEFPDAVRGEHGPLLPRARAAVQRARAGTTPGAAPAAEPATVVAAQPPEDAAMAQLERLARLHREGDLDDQEFARAKQSVLTKA